MDNRNEVRELLASRQAKITPDQAGLLAVARARASGPHPDHRRLFRSPAAILSNCEPASGIAKQNSLTETELKEAIIHLAFYAGWPKAMSAITVQGGLQRLTPWLVRLPH